MILQELHRSTPKKIYISVPVSLGGMKIDGNADCEGWRQICSNLARGFNICGSVHHA